MNNILVAGAGPAGLVAALKIARAGKMVTLLSPMENVKTLGECVPGAINRLLAQLELPTINSRNSFHKEVAGAMSLWAGRLQFDDYMNRAEGCAWRLDKLRFINAITDTVTAIGVRTKVGRIRNILQLDDSKHHVLLDNGELMKVDFIIDGTGRQRVVTRKMFIERRLGVPLIANWMIGKPKSVRTTDRTIVETVANGWWYGAFLPDRRPIAIFLTSPAIAIQLKRGAKSWKNLLASTQLVSEHLPPDAFPDQQPESTDARFSISESCFGTNWAACGDAAVSFDPISSQGVFNAMATGSMVADALLSEDHQKALQTYQQKVSDIAHFCERRRNLYYESAYLHFRSDFWKRFL